MEYFIGLKQQNLSIFDLDEIFARFYNLKGTLHADNGKFNDAIEYYNKAIKLNPSYHTAFFNRGTIKADMGNFEDARHDFKKAHELELNFELNLTVSKSLLNEHGSPE
jgi:tetratricopeptide (TPR) repeat protein